MNSQSGLVLEQRRAELRGGLFARLTKALWSLPAILALAMLLRLVAIFAFPNLNFADENYQLYEQGHRLAFGYGVKPWEFDDGIRSMVVPYAIAGLFAVSEPLFGGPQGYLWFAQIVFAALSLVPVATAYQMGRRISATHALLAGLVTASWFEIVYFSSKPLTEALATDFILVALSLASVPYSEISRRRLAAVGFCLAATVMLRLQLLPGVVFVAAWLCRLDIQKRWLWLAAGAAPVLILFGATDWLTWGAPFVSYVRAVWVNVGQSKASAYGFTPLYFYLMFIIAYWNLAAAALIPFIIHRYRRSVPWVGFAVIVIAVHSLIPHKEYRFIHPALACLVVVASLGSADFIEDARGRLGPGRTRLLTAAAASLWLLASIGLVSSPLFALYRTHWREFIQASFWVSQRPNLCGLALYDDSWHVTGGYAFLHRNVPIYALKRDHALASRSTQAFNFVLLRRGSWPDFQPAYRLAWCAANGSTNDLCLAERPGICSPAPGATPLLRQSRLGEKPDSD